MGGNCCDDAQLVGIGQVVPTYVPSCKVPTEWPPKMVDSEVLACFVSAGQHTIEGRMVVVEVVHVDQIDFVQAQASVNDQIQPCL